jgi:hypothetical protein
LKPATGGAAAKLSGGMQGRELPVAGGGENGEWPKESERKSETLRRLLFIFIFLYTVVIRWLCPGRIIC